MLDYKMSKPPSTTSVTIKSGSATQTAASSALSTKTVLSTLKSKIGTAKWQEIIADEERDLIVCEIREQLLQDVLDKCYEKYLDKQAVHFTVHCAYLALQKVLNVYFLKHDPGENLDKTQCWQPDTEPPVSEVDSWASGVIPVVSGDLQDQMRHQSVVYPPDILQKERSSKEVTAEMTQTHEPSFKASVPSDNQALSSSEPSTDFRRQQQLGSSAIRPSMVKKHHLHKSNTFSMVQYNPSYMTGKLTETDVDPLPPVMHLGGRQFPSARHYTQGMLWLAMMQFTSHPGQPINQAYNYEE